MPRALSRPEAIKIIDVAPGEGIRRERTLLATKLKQEIVERISKAGVAGIEIAAMTKVGGVDDAGTVVERLAESADFSTEGLDAFLQIQTAPEAERAAEISWVIPRVGLALTETSNQRLFGHSREETMTALDSLLETLAASERRPWIVLEAAFGCPFEGPVATSKIVAAVEAWLDVGVAGLTLTDSGALADPDQIARTLGAVPAKVDSRSPLALRLYNGRGLGLANAVAALDTGCEVFEVSAGGLGDSPFEPGAPGIVATEDLVHLAEALGVATGVDLDLAIRVGRRLEESLGRALPSSMTYAEPRSTLYRRLALSPRSNSSGSSASATEDAGR